MSEIWNRAVDNPRLAEGQLADYPKRATIAGNPFSTMTSFLDLLQKEPFDLG